MSRLFDFRKHSGEASETPSAPPKTRPCSRFSVLKVLNFVPTRPASPDSPYFTVRATSFYLLPNQVSVYRRKMERSWGIDKKSCIEVACTVFDRKQNQINEESKLFFLTSQIDDSETLPDGQDLYFGAANAGGGGISKLSLSLPVRPSFSLGATKRELEEDGRWNKDQS